MGKDFKIILPGICNASCSFCFWKYTPLECEVDWLGILENALKNATSEFTQLNISGGEPTISSYFKETMEIISKYRDKFTKVVLTTNGSNLDDVLEYIDGVVDHINISRHSYDSDANANIFNSSCIPDNNELHHIIRSCNHIGIDVTINTMVGDRWGYNEMYNFIKLIKKVGASYLVFRHDYSKGIKPSDFEGHFSGNKIVYSTSCDVCMSNTRLIEGVYVSWKYGISEPSDIIKDEVFEIILGQNGVLSLDYAGLKPFSFNKKYNRRSNYYV